MDINYTITFHTDWHCGSGLSASADVDALPIKDADGLPYVPGKTIKGLVRESLEELCTFNDSTSKIQLIQDTFGYFHDDSNQAKRGTAFFSNAELSKEESNEIIRCHAEKYLYRTLSNTAINRETGIAESHTLRKIDVTVPCQLYGTITGIPDELITDLENALHYIKRIGQGRNRGLGRCTFLTSSNSPCNETQVNNNNLNSTSRLQYKCTLLTDIILNQKAATTGPNNTLDFIPGSNFLGIVATQLYQGKNPDLKIAHAILHSGKVRFGDAHPSLSKETMIRGLHVPASMYYPKLEKPYNNCYVHHLIPNHEALNFLQLKQCRSGFYDFSRQESTLIEINKTFAIKSAYDRTTRRSKDEQMFGYESLRKGLVLLFEIEVDNEIANDINSETIKAAIHSALPDGIYRIGRSRTAQYGQVKIEQCPYEEINSQDMAGNLAIVYADARLIFIDEKTGQPTFRPSPQQLGFAQNDRILWDKCQIRTFQYAPFNYKRQCFDSDRCGIEKGSVFVVVTNSCPNQSRYIGSFQNEGFGKVIYNPQFLQADITTGRANYRIKDGNTLHSLTNTMSTNSGNAQTECIINSKESHLLEYIKQQQLLDRNKSIVYSIVNNWIKNNKEKFKGEKFASQWGSIRTIATQFHTKEDIKNKINIYISNGVAKEKWSANKEVRKKALNDFINDNHFDDTTIQMAIINLATEMAKTNRMEDNK